MNDFLERIAEPAEGLLKLLDRADIRPRIEGDLGVSADVNMRYQRVGMFGLIEAVRAGRMLDMSDRRLRVRRQNSPHLLQIGDTIGGGRVTGITIGHSYDSAKNGNDVMASSWNEVSGRAADRTIVGFVTPDRKGYWRRGTQMPMQRSLDPAINAKLELRHWHAQAKRCSRSGMNSWRTYVRSDARSVRSRGPQSGRCSASLGW